MIEAAREAGASMGSPGEQEEFDPNGPADDGNPMGTPEAELTLAVDVTGYLDAKRAAMRCHASQIEDTSFFLQMPDEAFAAAFGTEWFIEHDGQPPVREGWIFAR
jgi:LmbE family N-acetylglucosaminyl deacetylase